MRKITLILILAVSVIFLFAGCFNMDSGDDGENGEIRIGIDGSSSQSVSGPKNVVVTAGELSEISYQIIFTKGSETITHNIAAGGGLSAKVSVRPGTWSVTVRAIGANEKLRGKGTTTVSVKAGATSTAEVWLDRKSVV
jgi:hypothetical protein